MSSLIEDHSDAFSRPIHLDKLFRHTGEKSDSDSSSLHLPKEKSPHKKFDSSSSSSTMPDSLFAKTWANLEEMDMNIQVSEIEDDNLWNEVKKAFRGRRPITRGFKLKTKH